MLTAARQAWPSAPSPILQQSKHPRGAAPPNLYQTTSDLLTLTTIVTVSNRVNTDGAASLKRREPSMFSAFKETTLLVEVARGIADDRETAVRTITPT